MAETEVVSGSEAVSTVVCVGECVRMMVVVLDGVGVIVIVVDSEFEVKQEVLREKVLEKEA